MSGPSIEDNDQGETSNSGEITLLIRRYQEGDSSALDQLVEKVYAQLRTIARGQLRRRRPGDALDTTALVNEAYLKLSAPEKVAWKDREHFFATAARAMRHILVDQARGVNREKRGGGVEHVPLDEATLRLQDQADEMTRLDDALRKLDAVDPRAVRVVECRYFVGFTDIETAVALGTSPRTVQRLWNQARRWLASELSPA
ncbi:MAG: sigma-70 family RNA polymerase sigma factor [Thermoanaerobaculia bacterium]|nr:sigma-70 family RNA polymerase sigma factor [Thermoanaerobaculia bacterium]